MRKRKAKKVCKKDQVIDAIIAQMAKRYEEIERKHWEWVDSLNVIDVLNGWQLCLQPQDCTEWLSIHVRSPDHRASNKKGCSIGWDGERYANNSSGIAWLRDRFPEIAAWVDSWVQDGCPA